MMKHVSPKSRWELQNENNLNNFIKKKLNTNCLPEADYRQHRTVMFAKENHCCDSALMLTEVAEENSNRTEKNGKRKRKKY